MLIYNIFKLEIRILKRLCSQCSLPASGEFCRLLITSANSLDPDQAGQNVPPALGPNGLTPDGIPERIFLKS